MGSKFPWNRGQKECMADIIHWYKTQWKQVYQYGGYAGTGKTTIIPEILRCLKIDPADVLSLAFTGKAASNLTLKGIPATSIHSGLMEMTKIPKIGPDGNVLTKNGRPLTIWKFKRKEFLPKNIKLIFIDEAYFIPDDIGLIAESFGIPIIVCGDPGQLGPIFGKPRYLVDPDYTLDEITRTAKDSGIVELATLIREGHELPTEPTMFKTNAFVIPKKKITDELLINQDIILCGKNKTRNLFNRRLREDILGIKSQLPVKGDKIMCRHNYWNRTLEDIPLTNGIIGKVVHEITRSNIDLKSNTVSIDFMPDYTTTDYYSNLKVDIKYFLEECGAHEETFGFGSFNFGVKMELAHAITTHISQGSEFPNVLYWDEIFGDDDFVRRMRYTGVTRATEMAMLAV